jgi:hypothetical protein
MLLSHLAKPGARYLYCRLIDLATEQILVLRLEGTTYVEHGVFRRGAQVISVLLESFAIAVAAVLDAE